MILHDNLILPNGNTRCWDWDDKNKRYIMTEVPTHPSQIRKPRTTCLFVPGAPPEPTGKGGPRGSKFIKSLDGGGPR